MTDNQNIIYCPACGKEMKKIYMQEQNVNLDVCIDGCGGIFFDVREFRMFNQPCDDITALIQAYNGKTFEKTDETKIRICPSCGTKMVKNYSSLAKEIQVDDCYVCGGKFLDFGELEKIRNRDKQRRYNQASSVFSENQYKALENAGFLSGEEYEEENVFPVNYEAERKRKIANTVFSGFLLGVITDITLFVFFPDKLYSAVSYIKKYDSYSTEFEIFCVLLLMIVIICSFIGLLAGKQLLKQTNK